MFWSNKMKSYSAAIAVNKNLQFMQYTLSTLLSSFPWTTQKSIIVENSKIVENFGVTIFSTIMEFDCIWGLILASFALQKFVFLGWNNKSTVHNNSPVDYGGQKIPSIIIVPSFCYSYVYTILDIQSYIREEKQKSMLLMCLK